SACDVLPPGLCPAQHRSGSPCVRSGARGRPGVSAAGMSGQVGERETVPAWPRPAEFNAPCLISEKIDGTHVALAVTEIDAARAVPEGAISVTVGGRRWMLRAASRLRWLTDERDNFGFRAWVRE